MCVCGSLEAGNPAAPFGGMKASGFGRKGGSEGIHEYFRDPGRRIATS